MKDAKSYVRDDGAGQTTITSLAYLLTPEGINPITAELLRRSLERYSDADFSAAFDGATKDKARQFLAAYSLCRMPFWGAQELADAMAPATDYARALRSVELAQKAGELQAVFSPLDGVKWAMARGFLIGAHAKFLGIAGIYGNPHAPLSGDVLAVESQQESSRTGTPRKLTDAQEGEIVSLYNRGRGTSVRQLATDFGVSRPTIDGVLQRAGVKK